MSFIERPKGATLRRLQRPPEPEGVRFEDDYPIAMRCDDCGKIGYGPRRTMKEAVAEHKRTCIKRGKAEETGVVKLWYPAI